MFEKVLESRFLGREACARVSRCVAHAAGGFRGARFIVYEAVQYLPVPCSTDPVPATVLYRVGKRGPVTIVLLSCSEPSDIPPRSSEVRDHEEWNRHYAATLNFHRTRTTLTDFLQWTGSP